METLKKIINEQNKDFWNIVKGVGILSIVIGHTGCQLVPYVYLYHLVIFFFISGYLYSEEKYGDNPFLNFLTRLKKIGKNILLFLLFLFFYIIFFITLVLLYKIIQCILFKILLFN